MATPKDDLIINEPNNDFIVANFPKVTNDAGVDQVVIDENGWIVGVDPQAQPFPGNATSEAPEVKE